MKDEADSLDPGSMRAFSNGMLETETQRLWKLWIEDPGRTEQADEQARQTFDGAALVWANIDFAQTNYPSAKVRTEQIDECLMLAPGSVVLEALRGEAIAVVGVIDDLDATYETLKSINEHNVLPLRTLYLACRVAHYAAKRNDQALTDTAGEIAVRALESILRSPPADPMHQRYLAANLIPLANWSASTLDLATPAMAVSETAEDPWLALIVAGEAYRQQAWNARGSGFAHTVQDQGWEGFQKYMEKSADAFMLAHKLRPEAPEAAAAMIDVSKNLTSDFDTFSAWFSASFAAQKSWMPAIHSYYFSLRPRWFGSIEDMSAFVQWLTRFAPESEDIADYLFNATDQIGHELGSFSDLWLDDALANSIAAEMQRQIEIGRNPGNAMQRLLGIAWARGEWERASEILDEIGEADSWWALNQFHIHNRRIRDDVLLRSAGPSDLIQPALAAEKEGNPRQAVDHLRRAIETPGLPEEHREAMLRRLRACKWNADFHEGKRVQLSVEPGLPGWETWIGKSRAENDRIVFGTADDYAWVRPDINPGERYQIQMTMHKPAGDGNAWSMFVLGHQWHTFEQWHTVWIQWHDGLTWVQYRFDGTSSTSTTLPVDDGVVELNVLCYDGDLLVQADGVEIYRGPLSQGLGYTPGTQIYLSSWLQGADREAAFSNISLRKLAKRPQ